MIIATATSLFGQFHEDVFPGESGAQLITRLRLEFRPSNVLSYSEARELMYTEFYNDHDSVTCVYSGYQLYLDPGSQDPIGELFRNGDPNGINCEHTFPQSKGAGSGNPRSDMHHLFPTRSRVNEARLNYPFSEIDDRNTDDWFYKDMQRTSIPTMNIDAWSELGDEVFEPREDHKGNVARAVFYFYAVYRDVADASFFSSQRETLCEWHYLDPVDEKEWVNNIRIASFQSDKRNPFILDCTLAGRSFCPDVVGNCNITSSRDINSGITALYPNPVTDRLTIALDPDIAADRINVLDVIGRIVLSDSIPSGKTEITLFLADLAPGTYLLSLEDTRTGIKYRPMPLTIN